MAELDTLKSYLVSLGFAVDIASYRKMNQLLDQQKKNILNSTGVMSNAYVQAAKTIASVLVGVGAATVTLMDGVAKAELGFDLFGMKMYMASDAAKKVKIAVDALGYSLDEIAWNPELKKRFDELIRLQGGLQGRLGSDYKQTMRDIRDIRFEFTKMRVEGEYMMQVFVSELMKKLGISARDVHEALKKFNDWLVANMVPAMEKLAELFTNIWDITLMLGPSLSGLGKSFKEFQKAINVGDKEAGFLEWLGAVASEFMVFARSLTLVLTGLAGLGTAITGLVKRDPKLIKEGLSTFWKAATTKKLDLSQAGTDMLNEAGRKAAGRKPVMTPYKFGPPNQAVSPGVSKFKDLLSKYFPGQENVAAAIMKAESGNKFYPEGDPNAHNTRGGGTGAFGLFQIRGQLHRDALIKAGIIKSDKELFDPEKNFQAARYLYDRSGWRPWDESRSRWGKEVASSITVGDINVNVTGGANATAADIGKQAAIELQKKLEDLDRRRRQREIREFAGTIG